MRISKKVWNNFIKRLKMLDDTAAGKVTDYINTHDVSTDRGLAELISYSHAIATKYGEGAVALSAEMYDAIAELSGETLPPAVPASTATYNETARAVQGARLFSADPEVTSAAVGRLVKQAGVDTTMQNAIRDGAEWAWVPSGDSCAFCITLASRGWQRASKKALKGGHAEHIHNNCDCTYAISFDGKTDIDGYDPEYYKKQYYDAEGRTPEEKINYMRRQQYAAHKEQINEQKRARYAALHPKSLDFKITESELEKMSQDWFFGLGVKEQGETVAFDAYNFTRDKGREEDTKILENAISKFELSGPIKTYRGVGENEFSEMMFDYGSKGLKTTELKGTSISEDRAKKFADTRGGWIVEYHINRGNNGAYFDGGVPGSNEKQFVINRGRPYTVKSVDQKNKRIIIEIG